MLRTLRCGTCHVSKQDVFIKDIVFKSDFVFVSGLCKSIHDEDVHAGDASCVSAG